MKVIIVNQTKSFASAKEVHTLTNKICDYFLTKKIRNKALLKKKKEITIVFLSKSEIKKINNDFRSKNKPTDILSFFSDDPNSLGELLICTDVLKIQAREQKHSLKDEASYMLIHGILHLLGYDHELSKKEEELMFGLQDSCFSYLLSGRD